MSDLGTREQGTQGRAPQDRGHRDHGAVWEGFGDQNPSRIPCGDPTHVCKHVCPHVPVPPCAVTCVPTHTRMPQAW